MAYHVVVRRDDVRLFRTERGLTVVDTRVLDWLHSHVGMRMSATAGKLAADTWTLAPVGPEKTAFVFAHLRLARNFAERFALSPQEVVELPLRSRALAD